MKHVIGIGNALTDMLVNLKTDSVLERYDLPKGSMSLVGNRLQTEISKSVAGLPYSLSLGGSAGNTIRAMAQLGCKVGFIGKVGQDTTGDFFVQALENLKVAPKVFRGKERSGKCSSRPTANGPWSPTWVPPSNWKPRKSAPLFSTATTASTWRVIWYRTRN